MSEVEEFFRLCIVSYLVLHLGFLVGGLMERQAGCWGLG